MKPECAEGELCGVAASDGSAQDRRYMHKVAQLLSDRYVISILAAIAFKSYSAHELCVWFDIPSAVCYRKIKELLELDLLSVSNRVLTRGGKWTTRFRSNVQRVNVSLETGKYRLSLKLRESPEEIIIIWDPVKEQGQF